MLPNLGENVSRVKPRKRLTERARRQGAAQPTDRRSLETDQLKTRSGPPILDPRPKPVGSFKGLSQEASGFGSQGLWPTAHLEVHRNFGETPLYLAMDPTQREKAEFYSQCLEGFRSFLQTALSKGLTMATFSYPVLDEESFSFHLEELEIVFLAHDSAIAEFRSRLRIVSSRSLLHSLIQQIRTGQVDTALPRTGISNPLRDLRSQLRAQPRSRQRRFRRNRTWTRLWHEDRLYYQACDGFDARKAPKYDALSAFKPLQSWFGSYRAAARGTSIAPSKAPTRATAPEASIRRQMIL